ncbi:hypothetical protein [Pseudomonas costantinii]|uniref:hypothetical protein n=1 Tax=Pseudomonas costantinii TaxID=168469 RepID=UPI0015A2F795|nr:hypothetical protein [Pseudomonas costantinii]NVZ67595.1 hypothetical protein [Pseudomonas costantinii]
MGNNTYLIIGALIVIALIVVVLIRKSKAKKAKPPSEPIAVPPAEVQITPDLATSPFTLEPSTSSLEPASSTGVEVWNQTDFPVVVTQQDLRVTLPPQGRAQMDSRFPLTATPETSADAVHGVSLQSSDTPNCLIIRAIDKQ